MLVHKSSTLFLKIVIVFIGIFTILFCIPTLRFALSPMNFEYLPHFIVLYLSLIPFYIALYQTLKLLNLVDRNKAFSTLTIKLLKYIKYCAVVFAAMYSLIMPYVYYRGDVDDAPGPIAIAFVFIFVSVVIASAVAVLQKLIENAVYLKNENDLTV